MWSEFHESEGIVGGVLKKGFEFGEIVAEGVGPFRFRRGGRDGQGGDGGRRGVGGEGGAIGAGAEEEGEGRGGGEGQPVGGSGERGGPFGGAL